MAAPGTKQAVRKHMKSLIKQLSEISKKEQSLRVCEKVLGSDVYKGSDCIAVYVSMPDEVQTKPIIKQIIADNKSCYIPKYSMDSRHMDMVKLRSMEDLESLPFTKWNIQQPDDSLRENALVQGGLDLILVPGMAFTTCGKRLGRGKGYYDTYLNRHEVEIGKRPITMALAFTQQILQDVPIDEHDYLLDHVISEHS